MWNNKKDTSQTKFGFGLLVGMALGALAGVLLAPKSGEETRKEAMDTMKDMRRKLESGELQERVKQIFGDLSDQSRDLYTRAREEVMLQYDQARNMSREDFKDMVNHVVDNLRQGTDITADKANKLKKNLTDEYEEHVDETEQPKKRGRKA